MAATKAEDTHGPARDVMTRGRALAIAGPLRWTPDASFRERDQALGPEFSVELFSPTGELTELSGDALRVLQTFGGGATPAEVATRLGAEGADVEAIVELAATLERRGFLKPFDGTDAASPPVPLPPAFLVGAHGCGATLLRWLLDAHDQLACAPPHRLALPLRDMADLAAQTDAFSVLDVDPRQALGGLGRVVGELLTLHARLRQKSGWVWASRDHDLCLHFLDDMFEGAGRFICMVRHPFDAAESSAHRHRTEGWHAQRMIRLLRRHDTPHLAYAHYWRDVYRRVRAFKTAHPDRVFVVRYEDLVRDPAAELTGLFAFLGLGFRPSLIEDAFVRPHEVLEGGWESFGFQGVRKIVADHVGLWRNWDNELIDELTSIVGDEMARWRYAAGDAR